MKTKIVTIVLVIMLLGSANAQTIPIGYYITDLGTLGSDHESKAYGINESGQVVGYSGTVRGTEAGRRAFLWDNGTMVNLGTLGGDHSEAYAINNLGQIVGRSSTAFGEGDVRGFLWENGSILDLGTLSGGWTEAHGINNSSQITGYSVLSNSVVAFSWENGSMTNIGSLSDNSRGYSINDAGLIVGYCFDSTSFYTTASLWENVTITPLGSLGSEYNYAWGINNYGQIVGESGSHAFLWENGSGGMIDLGIGSALAINDSVQVVGTSGGAAFLWENGTKYDLNTLLVGGSGWILSEATAINNVGQIVGSGLINGEIHGYLLTPVPEPTTLLILALGGLFLRKRKS